MGEIKERREKIIEQHKIQQDESTQKMNSIVNSSKNIDYSNKFQEQTSLIMELMRENRELKEKMDYLEKKIKDLISNRIQEMKAATK
jgi:hypothetical protein